MIHSRVAFYIILFLMTARAIFKIFSGIMEETIHDTYGSEDVLVGCILLFLVFLAW